MTKLLHGFATTFVAAGLLASPAAAQTMPPDEYMELARSIFVELIEINTVNSELGNNTQAARAMERRLLDAGFPLAWASSPSHSVTSTALAGHGLEVELHDVPADPEDHQPEADLGASPPDQTGGLRLPQQIRHLNFLGDGVQPQRDRSQVAKDLGR